MKQLLTTLPKFNLNSLRLQYALFIGTLLITIVGSQLVIQYDLNTQNEDARLINLAGRQRMLSQRISKLIFYLNQYGEEGNYKIDSLASLVNRFEMVQTSLKNGDTKLNISARHSPDIDSLLRVNEIHLKSIVKAGRSIIAKPDSITLAESVEILEKHELPFLLLMEATVATYQREAEAKLNYIKKVEIILASFAMLLLLGELLFIFLPMIKRITTNNRMLNELNAALSVANNELQATEEELRSNMEQMETIQAHLEAREQQYSGLVNGASDMIFELDADGRFTFANPVMERITGYTKAELFNTYYWDLILPVQKSGVIEFYRKQGKAKQENSYLELPILSKEGELIWIGQNVRMFFKEGTEKIWKVSSVARDVTQRILTEQNLRASEERFRTLAEKAPIGIFQTDNEGNAIYMNPRWAEIAEMELSLAMGSGWSGAIHEGDREAVFAAWQKAVKNSAEFSELFRLLTPSGKVRWVRGKATPLKDIDEKVVGYIGTINDVTDIKEAQRRIEESERHYRLISDNSSDVISLHNLDSTFTFVTASIKNLHGYEPEEVLGRKALDFMHPDDAADFDANELIVQLQKVNELPPVQFRIITKHGQTIWGENIIKPIFTNGVLSGFQSAVRDITKRKIAEEALLKAKNEAEEATRAKSQFLSMMSHEIRTPMNAIIGLTNLLLQEEPRPDQKESLKLLKFSGDNLLTIINDILDFSKIEAGKIVMEQIDFDLQQLIQNIVNMLKTRASEKGIQLFFVFDANVPKVVVGDPVRIGQIITNLLGNAIKFTEKGYVEVKVAYEGSNGKQELLQVTVKDTGIGIPEENIKQIFESFTQASEDTTRKFGGTGLGLSITKRLLDLMNSTIAVDSKLGYGSTFSFLLKVRAGDLARVTYSLQKSEEQHPIVKGKILMAEDNRVNQIVANNFFKKWGLEIDIANNGIEAVRMVQSKSYKLILMDLQMPQMDGLEAAKIIRSMDTDAYFKNIPIIALTASAMAEVKNQVSEAGMNDYVTKPFDPDQLYAKILHYLDHADNQSLEKVTTFEKPRRVGVDFDLYTEGDPDFKREFISLMLKNLEELKVALETSVENEDPEVYTKTAHKVRTTVFILGDNELTSLIDELKKYIEAKDFSKVLARQEAFNKLWLRVKEGLEEEIGIV